MSLSLGNAIAVSTNFIKSNPAVPVYKGDREMTPVPLLPVWGKGVVERQARWVVE